MSRKAISGLRNQEKDSIIWRVLNADEASDGKFGVFLLSKYVLVDQIAFEKSLEDDYDGQHEPKDWKYSDL